jgi:two-component system nitrogen regulation response regulator GlnG
MSEASRHVVIVDDEKDICGILATLLRREGVTSLLAHDGETALKMVRLNEPDMVLADVCMPDMDGMVLLERIKELDPDLPVVLITGYAKVRGAIEAMKKGAHDYLAKPFDHAEVLRVVHRALAERDLKCRLRHLSGQLRENSSLGVLMGPSSAVARLVAEVTRVANSDFSVVIQGETGAGKELVARAIHRSSRRAENSFVPIDCGAIPDNLLESELFGHEKGAFTSADTQKPGKFELAKGGTLFLDELSNMPFNSQAKLLRALQEKKIYRVGGTKPVDVDVRLLVATNLDLQARVADGSFRHDLFYRLNEFTIRVPPLRERREDILYLVKRFMDVTNIELGKCVSGLTEPAVEALLTYDWPGNVRQLRSVIRRAVLLANEMITEQHFDFELKKSPAPDLNLPTEIGMGEESSLKDIVRRGTIAIEREVLTRALRQTGGNKAKAARLLQIDYKTMHTKVKQLGISSEGGWYEQEENRWQQH